jgi:hypothetical protein
VLRGLGELDGDVGELGDVGQEPRLRPVREVRVGQQVDRRAVLERDPRRLDRCVEAAARPNITISRSACSGFVGIPVEGPARWMSRISSGSSSMIARPTVSALRTTPGPLEVEIPSAPPNEAPRAAPTAEISSSAWNVRTPKCL